MTRYHYTAWVDTDSPEHAAAVMGSRLGCDEEIDDDDGQPITYTVDYDRLAAVPDWVDVVFDGPPSMPAPRFVECEHPEGRSIRAGEWIDRGDSMWALRIPTRLARYDPEALSTFRRGLDALALEVPALVHDDVMRLWHALGLERG